MTAASARNMLLWLVCTHRERATSGGRAKSGGTSKKKQAAAAAAASGGGASAVGGDKQRTVKDFFGVVKVRMGSLRCV